MNSTNSAFIPSFSSFLITKSQASFLVPTTPILTGRSIPTFSSTFFAVSFEPHAINTTANAATAKNLIVFSFYIPHLSNFLIAKFDIPCTKYTSISIKTIDTITTSS